MFIVLLIFVSFVAGRREVYRNTGSIQWRDCGDENAWIAMKDFNIGPYPIVMPGEMKLMFDLDFKHDVDHGVSLNLRMEKKLFDQWREFPCDGSCTVDDFCEQLKSLQNNMTCPAQLVDHSIPCVCPYLKGSSLTLPETNVEVKSGILDWSFLTQGDYRMTMTANEKSTGKVRGCVDMYLSIAAPS